jgi:hypothetical protein
VFKRVEELEQLVADPFAVAPPSDPGQDKDARLL